MVDYQDSSQLNQWLFSSPDVLDACRSKANRLAREYLSNLENQKDLPLPCFNFACGYSHRVQQGKESINNNNQQEQPDAVLSLEDKNGHSYLTPQEEALLVSFYVSKLPLLIGPLAQVARLRREPKVTATAALLLRRFFLNNSVMLYDPKVIMVAAAFLASKVEDCMTDVRYLEEGTAAMNAPVSQADILSAELSLLSGTNFNLLCFHPYKPVMALTEDMRTFLKSDKGKNLVLSTNAAASPEPLSAADLKPIYDAAKKLLDDVVVSDVPLLFSPGQVGIAALKIAQEQVLKDHPKIDFLGYLNQRFDAAAAVERTMKTSNDESNIKETVETLCAMLKALKQGQYGCANHMADLTLVKGIHKKLKKVRVWGQESSTGKKKRRNANEHEPDAKRQKNE
jgi:cyclin H